MRRSGAYVLVALGLIAVFLAPLAKFYVIPRVKKIPTDYYFRAVSVGTASYLDPSHGFAVVGPVRIENIHLVKGDPAASSRSVAVWDSFDSTFDVDNRHELSYAIDRYTFDRTSALGVACCGQNEDRAGDLSLLMPIGVEKRTYPRFWDSTAKRAFPLVYQATEPLDGLTVYRYQQHVEPMQIDTLTLPGKLVGQPDRPSVTLRWMYTADTDVWAEPVTGAIIQATQKADQWLADDAGTRVLTIATTDIGQTPDTVRRIVDLVSGQRTRLQVLQGWLPTVGPVVGLLLVLLGIAMGGGIARERVGAAPVQRVPG
ncbi:MAG TPA: DUF3068 domain-containing protein [Actinomycetota bacterium]|nr:DUF3068 domain-containing protein [Actinomycetota bacterium]